MQVLHKSLLGRCLILLIEQKTHIHHYGIQIFSITKQYILLPLYIITLIYKYKHQILHLKENAET